MLGLLQWVLALAVGATGTGTVTGKITVRKKDGTDKADYSEVVVYVADLQNKTPGAPAEVRQINKQFMPRVLAISVGTRVGFPNEDILEHNVFSHSAIAEFDLGRFGRGLGKSRVFDTVGVAEVFCNVHKEMVSYIVVVPSSAFAITGKAGNFTIPQIPAGRHRLIVWERFARPRTVETSVEVLAGGTATLNLDLQEQVDSEPPHKNKFGVDYAPLYH